MLPFFMQILLSDFPEHLGHAFSLKGGISLDKHLLQFFHCLGEGGYDNFEAYSSGHFIRIVDLSDYNASKYKSVKLKQTLLFDERLIIGWMKKRDYSHAKDYIEYNLTKPDDDDTIDM